VSRGEANGTRMVDQRSLAMLPVTSADSGEVQLTAE